MNREDEFELRLAEWLEEGPFLAPEAPVAAAIEHARTHPRRRLLRSAFRRSAMDSLHLNPVTPRHGLTQRAFAVGVAAVVVVVAVVAGGALMIARNGGTPNAAPAAVAAPSPGTGHIYWTNHMTGTIGRANLDGTGVNQSFITGATAACGLVVVADHIYWSSDADNTIGRANLDGTDVNPRLIRADQGICGLASDGTYLYWTTSIPANGTIARANLDGTGVDPDFIGLSYGRPRGIGIAVGGGRVYWANVLWDIGLADLDRTFVQESMIALADTDHPNGVAVSGSHIYWGNGDSTTIGRANLDGSGLPEETFIQGLPGNPGGLATDGTYLYWSVFGGSIGRANLDGTDVNKSFISGAAVPYGVAVGP